MRHLKRYRAAATLPLAALLAGCNAVVLSPSGDVAARQRDLVVHSTLLILLIVVPVIIATLVFAWRYRASNAATAEEYRPEWDHSTLLELLIWAAPLLIIIALGAMTWVHTHKLDPYRPLEHLDSRRTVPGDVRPLEVEVVALDWKWLFVYPEQGIALVNEMAAPVDRPIHFRITASSVMNSFYIPALAGQVYAMPSMVTQLNAVINRPGDFEGFSANYSGAGFSHMRFRFRGLDAGGFDRWVAETRAAGGQLDRGTYLQLERPSADEPVRRFAQVDPALYDAIVNRCVEPNRMCVRDMMALDAQGGAGHAGIGNITSLDRATRRRLAMDDMPARQYVGALCTVADPSGLGLSGAAPAGRQL